MIRKKCPQLLEKVAITLAKPKNANTSATTINLKDHIIYAKPLLKPGYTYN
jgi:hypothetical protein